MIVILDYKVGNLGSILNMLKKVGAHAIASSNRADILKADKLILPGVGSFDYGMEQLENSGLIDVLNEKVIVQKTPILGICLGIQLFTKKSEEGHRKGLRWLDMETIKFKSNELPTSSKVPHMGWNGISVKKESRLFKDMYEDARFYFVHSYHLSATDDSDILATTNYGYNFISAIEKDNIAGVQFHPEKSHKFGMKLLKNFAELS